MTQYVPVTPPPVSAPAPVLLRDPGRSGRVAAAVCGGLSAVALFVAVASVDVPRNVPDEELVAWFKDGGNRTADVVSTFSLLACGLLFLVFVTALARHVADRASGAARLAQQAGTLFVAFTFATGLGGAIVRGLVVDDEPVPDADVLRFFAQMRYTAMGVYAMPTAALVIACFTWAAFREGALPRWLGWLGVACIVVTAVATGAFVGQFAIPALLVWTLAAAWVLARPEIR